MNRSRAGLKAELLGKFEMEFDALLDWAESNRAPTLMAIEEAVLRCRREMGEAMAEGVVNAQEAEMGDRAGQKRAFSKQGMTV